METDVAYLAGFLDGEGSISLEKRSNGRFRTVMMSVSSTDRYLLEAFLRFGGDIRARKKSPKETHAQAWEYRIRGNDAVEAIRLLFPYLRHHVKRFRATMILDHYSRLTKRNGKYTEEELKQKIRFEESFLSITSRGPGRFQLDC